MKTISTIIVSYNVKQYLQNCIETVKDSHTDISYEIIVVDNASSDGTVVALTVEHPDIKLITNNDNVGFAAANNQGYKVSTGEYILILNPDTIIKPSAVKKVFDFMEATPDAGLAACRLLNEDGSLQRSVKRLPTVAGNLLQALFLDRLFFPEYRRGFYYRDRPFRIGYPSGAFMMVRREALKGAALLNEKFFMYAEEKDLARRLNQDGYGCYFVPGAEVIHHGGKSTDQTALPMFLELQKSQAKFINTYYSGIRKAMLHWSYWAVLATHFIAATFFAFSKYGRYRLNLLFNAFIKYPRFIND